MPRIMCDTNRYELGNIQNGQLIERKFVLKNGGTSLLTFKGMKACCGVNTTLDQDSLQPGSEAVLKVAFKVQSQNGSLSRSVYIHSNDPNTRYYQLQIIGKVYAAKSQGAETTSYSESANGVPDDTGVEHKASASKDIVAIPRQLTLIDGDVTSVRYLAIRSSRNIPFKITNVEIPWGESSFRLTALGVSVWRVELHGIADSQEKHSKELIVIHTDRDDQPHVLVPIRRILP